MAFFGVIKAGGTVAPVAHDSTTSELVNIARASGAVGLIIGEDLLDKRPDLAALFPRKACPRGCGFRVGVRLQPLAVEEERGARWEQAHPDAWLPSSSLGHTGHPKGVMLTHRNFTFHGVRVVAHLRPGPTDGMLSVLPLHHTFEFSTGLLVPLARGGGITYLQELTGDPSATCSRRVRSPPLWACPRWGDAAPAGLAEVLRRSAVVESLVNALTRPISSCARAPESIWACSSSFPCTRGWRARAAT